MSDLDSLIQLCSSSEGMKDLCWNSLATIDGTNCFDWNSIKEGAHNSSLDIFDDVWICQPIVVRNQRLFKFDEEFLRAVQKCTNKRQLAAILRKFKYNNATRETKKINPVEDFSTSFASSLDMTGLSFYTAPSRVKGAHSSAIIGVGRWFTDGHVDEGGYISVSLTPIGRKLFMIAKRGAASNRLFAMTSTIESFVSWVLKGPKLPCEKNIF